MSEDKRAVDKLTANAMTLDEIKVYETYVDNLSVY